MSLDDPVILTCSISGAVANREQCPAIPYTPEEYAAEARRIVDEGGSMIHIHASTPDGTPSYEVEDFRAITEAILAEVGDVVSVPGGAEHAFVNVTDRPARQLVMILPGLDAAAFFTELGTVMQAGVPERAVLNAFGARWGMEFLGPPLRPSDNQMG